MEHGKISTKNLFRLSLTNASQKFNRQECDKYPLKHGDEIKISDYSLIIEESNINKHVTDLYSIY